MALECKSSDVGNSDAPKRGHKMLPWSEKIKVILSKERKKSYAEVAEIYDTQKNLLSVKLWGKKQKSPGAVRSVVA